MLTWFIFNITVVALSTELVADFKIIKSLKFST